MAEFKFVLHDLIIVRDCNSCHFKHIHVFIPILYHPDCTHVSSISYYFIHIFFSSSDFPAPAVKVEDIAIMSVATVYSGSEDEGHHDHSADSNGNSFRKSNS